MNDRPADLGEEGRLAALARYAILDTAPEHSFDDLAVLVARICGCSMAYVSFIDAGRQWLKAAHGFNAEALNCQRDGAFCNDAIRETDLLIVPDLAAHPRYAGYATVTGPPHLRFYAGAPLLTNEGFALGTLCVVDTVPRDLNSDQRAALRQLARQVITELELRRRLAELDEANQHLTASESELRAAHERLGLDYRSVLDNMADGVLTVGPDGRIGMVNPAAAAILGVAMEDLRGSSLLEALPDAAETDDFVAALMAPLDEGAPESPGAVAYRRGGDIRQIAVHSTAYRLEHGPARGKPAIIAAFNDVTEREEMRAALSEQHTKLQKAYLDMEESSARLGVFAKRVQLVRFAATGFVFLIFAAVGAYMWIPRGGGMSFGFAPAQASVGENSITMTPQTVSSRIAVVGAIDAGSAVTVVGPFDGLVAERLFRYGGTVERGVPILRLNTSDLDVRIRDARGVFIRARQKSDELRNWATGVEVSRAKRTVNSTQLDIGDLQTKTRQTKMLLDRGIVSAEEYKGQVQQLRSLGLQLQAAQQDLATTVDRGSPENVSLAGDELANAQAKVTELETDLSKATVLAPVSGVVLQPPESGGKRGDTIEVGSRVSRGQTVVVIGDLETYSVKANVDEIDVAKVRVGQAVRVTGDAFDGMALTGKITSVAAQASGDNSARTGLPTFPVTVQISGVTPEQRAKIYIGMSANLSIIAYENEEAIVVPLNALHGEDGQRTVNVRTGAAVQAVAVTLGLSTPDGVEIRSGLKPGDVVVLGD
jgi:PAS domain S-box-containing protein